MPANLSELAHLCKQTVKKDAVFTQLIKRNPNFVKTCLRSEGHATAKRATTADSLEQLCELFELIKWHAQIPDRGMGMGA